MIHDIYKRIFWYWYRHTGYIKSFGYALYQHAADVSRFLAARPSFAFVVLCSDRRCVAPLDSFTFIHAFIVLT